MTKNQAWLQSGMSLQFAGPAGFLPPRQHVTQLTSLDVAGGARYVWRKVFLRGRKGM
ncbi:MAG: hypothetical protein HY078_12825 [Elusimicrobia bacterium]|nr:hypothetical protein [Elusimicrobiota bacterium]